MRNIIKKEIGEYPNPKYNKVKNKNRLDEPI
jgi:hypothetical protein